eukprot:SAG31_NODE_16065_length_724_cov_3.286400_1_plen_28_part_01
MIGMGEQTVYADITSFSSAFCSPNALRA